MVFILKRIKILKSFFSLLTALIMSNGFVLSTFATDIQCATENEKTILLDEAIKLEANSWIASAYDNKVEIDDITPIIEPNTYSFCVSYEKDKIPCGYAVFMYINGEFIVSEYTNISGSNDIYTDIKDEILSERAYNRCKDIGDFMFKTGPLEYAVGYINEKGELHNEDCFGNEVSTPNFVLESVCDTYNNEKSIFIDINNFINTSKYQIVEGISYDVSGAKFDKKPTSPIAEKGDYKALWDAWYVNSVKKYNCGLTADLHILAIKNQLGNFSLDDIRNTYKKLMNMATKKVLVSTSNGINYYSMYATDTSDVLTMYLKLNTPYKNTISTYKQNPASSWIKSEIKNNHPIVLSYHIKTKNGKSDHAVTIFSFRRAKKVSSGNTYNYLGVFDGWTYNPKFINYTTVDFTGVTEAFSYEFKK